MSFVYVIVIIFIILAIIYFLFKKRARLNAIEVANIIERFINKQGSEWEWDDFISVPINDPLLDNFRTSCSRLPSEYPPIKKGEYTNEKGIETLKRYVVELKSLKKQ